MKSETAPRTPRPVDERTLADVVKDLQAQFATERAERHELDRVRNHYYEREGLLSMSASISLGDVVLYQPPTHLGTAACFALVLAVHDDGAADLRIANGYCAGWSDLERVQPSDEGDPGTFFPKGTKKTKDGKDVTGPLRPPVEIPPSDPWGALGAHGPASIPYGMLGSPITEAEAKARREADEKSAQTASSKERDAETVESNA
jgi:hypothetical protein